MLKRRMFALIINVFYLLSITVSLTACAGPMSDTSNGPSSMSSSTVAGKTTAQETSVIDHSQTQDTIEPQASSSENTAVSKPVFAAERERKYIDVEWKPVSYEKKVAPYKIKDNLSNVKNLDQFGSFSSEQMKMLSDNGFLVIPSKEQQLFYIYENNEYLQLPSFITSDSVLQVYHVFFDYSLRTLEYEYLLGDLEHLTGSMLDKSIKLYDRIQNPDVKSAALKNVAYFAVAQKALEKVLPEGIPDEALKIFEAEFKLVSGMQGFEKSPIFGFKLDYSQYRPRGHYTRNHDFERFFKAMMWYGQVPFPLLQGESDNIELVIPETLQALLMTYSLFTNGSGEPDIELWENIYDPTVFYVGSADDLTIYNYKDLLIKVYGKEPDPETFSNEDKLGKLFEEAKKLPKPRIQANWTTVDTPVGAQFRFMGQRYIPDSEILQNLVAPILRPMPKGLDVMGVLGSDRAHELLIDFYKEDKSWSEYPKKFSKMKEQFTTLPEKTWRSNMYYGWLWVLKSFTGSFGNGYPSFMTNQAWQDKSLNTALGSWAELRHDTILYGKQSGAEMGGDFPPANKGYVEPNVEIYEKLLWLTKYSKENLAEKQILPSDLESRMQDFEDLLQFLMECSVKELRNEELMPEEYNRLQFYGGMLEYLTSSLAQNGMRWFEITSETDKNMAVVADVHTTPGRYLEEGVGPAAEIYAVVPIGGRLYLTRGAVFSYYEFVSDIRLTDEEWQKMFNENKQPALPEWTDSFIDRKGAKAEIPAPRQPGESGN